MKPGPSMRRTRHILRGLARDVRTAERALSAALWYDDPWATARQARERARDIVTRDTARPADIRQRATADLMQLAAARGLALARVAQRPPMALDLQVWRAGDTLCVWSGATATATIWGMAVTLVADDLPRLTRDQPPAQSADVIARLAAHVLLTERGLSGLPTARVLAFMGVPPSAVGAAITTVAPLVAAIRSQLEAAANARLPG